MKKDDLVLTPPDAVLPIEKEKSAGLVPLKPEQTSELERKANEFVDSLCDLDENSPEFGAKVDQLTRLGKSEIEKAASQSNRFLDRPVKAMHAESGVGADITALRRKIEELDPKSRGNLLAPKKILGVIPFGNKLRDYFQEYESAQKHISAILERLDSGRDELLKDNAAIDIERQALWDAMGKLEQTIYVGKMLDQKLEQKAIELASVDAEKAQLVRQGALFSVRQRMTDLLTQMAVSVQGYLALDLVKKNNVELVKGVERASTTTVSALRTAVTVAQALTNQKLVLAQIKALNATTANIIEGTSEMLKSQSAEIHEQAASAMIPIETLQRSFDNIYQTMDAIDDFKEKALANMKETADALGGEVERAKGYISRAEGTGSQESDQDPFRLAE